MSLRTTFLTDMNYLLGLDTTRPPTTMEMMKLAMNSEFRQGAQKLMEELKKAGIDLTSSSVRFGYFVTIWSLLTIYI
jgi:hypothetical protein